MENKDTSMYLVVIQLVWYCKHIRVSAIILMVISLVLGVCLCFGKI